MLTRAETIVCNSIGLFSTVPQAINPRLVNSEYGFVDQYMGNQRLPGQCRAFLVSVHEFTWFVEKWSIVSAPEGSAPETPKVTLENKKTYPAKVTGIGLSSLFTETITWRNGLINTYVVDENASFRPGLGELIPDDLSRLIESVSVQRNDLGLGEFAQADSVNFCGPLGRLMSIASYVDPDLAKQYDDSKNKKKKKSPNEQDYQQMPEYPPYTPYQDNSGY